ncbi:MAG: DUF87 domain-containing protein [Candidatus Lokiarchaeota archaeon]|nr:DUF87 domain-containing protein [Candidatus Lokiarchaeota archaeon]
MQELTSNDIVLGTIFSSIQDDSPNVDHFYFILDEKTEKLSAKQGLFCYTISEEGMILGKIESILVHNEYYEKPQTVKNLDSGSFSGIRNYFPSDQWEDYIANVKVLGTFPFESESNIKSSNPKFSDSIIRSSFPAKPGSKVYVLKGDRLERFLGIDSDGLNIGTLEHYNIDVRLNINRLINKHLAVLAISGAGKSYLVSDIIEELLLRKNNQGTPGVLLFDVHGEYKFISDQGINENSNFANKTKYYDAKYFEIDVSQLTAYDIRKFQPNISHAQTRELKNIIFKLKKEEKSKIQFDLNDLINKVEDQQQMNSKVREALSSWLNDLNRLKLFSKSENPPVRNLISPGRMSILDLSSIISIRKKQIIVSYILETLFFLRRIGKIAPFLAILEEAHQFAPDGVNANNAISKKIIETLAREGRKFYAQLCLISQRPVKLSTTALSQCNTHIILRVTNPNDLDHIKASSEALTSETLKMISTLPTGNALIMGAATNMPLFVKVRPRFCSNPDDIETLETICKNYQS